MANMFLHWFIYCVYVWRDAASMWVSRNYFLQLVFSFYHMDVWNLQKRPSLLANFPGLEIFDNLKFNFCLKYTFNNFVYLCTWWYINKYTKHRCQIRVIACVLWKKCHFFNSLTLEPPTLLVCHKTERFCKALQFLLNYRP